MTHRDTLFICFSDIHANEQRIPRIKAKLDRLSIRAKTLKDKYNKSYIVFLVPVFFNRVVQKTCFKQPQYYA